MVKAEVEAPEPEEIKAEEKKDGKPKEKEGFDNLGKTPVEPTQKEKDEKEAEKIRKWLTKKGIKFHPATGLDKLRKKKEENK